MKLVNPFEVEGRWFKANLHTHSTESDGQATPAERVAQYGEQGYEVLALTDHWVSNDAAGMGDDGVLVLRGIEMHPAGGDGALQYHLVGLNVPEGFKADEQSGANELIETVRQLGGEVVLAHPYWCGHNINHCLAMKGYVAVEVYNATCGRIGKAYSSVVWDDLLDAGRVVPAVGVDDVHYAVDLFKGWTMIKAQELTVEAVMGALREGCFYASCGPVIEDFRLVGDKVRVQCTPVREIHFMSQRASGGSVYAEDGETLTTAEGQLAVALGYVRAEVVDELGRRAWTNPIMLG